MSIFFCQALVQERGLTSGLRKRLDEDKTKEDIIKSMEDTIKNMEAEMTQLRTANARQETAAARVAPKDEDEDDGPGIEILRQQYNHSVFLNKIIYKIVMYFKTYEFFTQILFWGSKNIV